MSFILKHPQEMLRESADVTLMPVSTICKLKSTFPYPKEMFIKRKKSFRMSHYMIWIWLTPNPKEETIL